MIKPMQYRQVAALCTVAMLGQLLQVWLLRELWWDNQHLLVRWLRFAVAWGAVVFTTVGVYLGRSLTVPGVGHLSALAVRSRYQVLGLPLGFLSLLTLVIQYGLAYGLAAVTGGLGAPEPLQPLAGTTWLMLWLAVGLALTLLFKTVWCYLLAPFLVFLATSLGTASGIEWLSDLVPTSVVQAVALAETASQQWLRIGITAFVFGAVVAVMLRFKKAALACLVGASLLVPWFVVGRVTGLVELAINVTPYCKSVGEMRICFRGDAPSGEKLYESVLLETIARYPVLVAGIDTITNDLESEVVGKTLAVGMGTLENSEALRPNRAGILWSYANAVTQYRCASSTGVDTVLSLKVASLLLPSLLEESEIKELKTATEDILSADAAALEGYQKLMAASDQEVLDIIVQRRSSAAVCARELATYR